MAAVDEGSVLHVSPHPDDEALGCPATLLTMKEIGFRITNLACSLGREEQQDRRLNELREGSRRSGFHLSLPDISVPLSLNDNLHDAELRLRSLVKERIEREHPLVIVSPHPHDGHHGHEVVARAVRLALKESRRPGIYWWMWGLWMDLNVPTVYVPFGQQRMEEAISMLSAYGGELERNDYLKLLRARAEAMAVLGSERVFGYGSSSASTEPYAELLTEVLAIGTKLAICSPRRFEFGAPLGSATDWDVDDMLSEHSIIERYRTLRQRHPHE